MIKSRSVLADSMTLVAIGIVLGFFWRSVLDLVALLARLVIG